MSGEQAESWIAAEWRRHRPLRSDWGQLLCAPSSYLLIVGLVTTVLVKAQVMFGFTAVGAIWPVWFLVAISADVALLSAIIALLAVAEQRRPWTVVVTTPMALLLFGATILNAYYLSITGEQLTWEAVELGLERFDDASTIAGDNVASHSAWWYVVLAIALTVPPAYAFWQMRRSGKELWPWLSGRPRVRPAALIALGAGLFWLVTPRPANPPAARLARNAVVHTYWGWADGAIKEQTEAGESFSGYHPIELVAPPTAGDGAPRLNVITIVLESTRYDFTGLIGERAPARTPALVALAERGVSMRSARAVLPHTTKSLFSIYCARYPLLQLSIRELSSDVRVQCLGGILAARGYSTAFFQSAQGWFESRPRLVQKFGFGEFVAAEDIGGESLGYVSSDDESLSDAVLGWIDRRRASGPFFAAVLTSGPHHPYRLSSAAQARAAESGRPTDTDAERYVHLLEAQDHMLARLFSGLEARGVVDETIIVVVGDHGEGFGSKGVKQHDNNFYDEGLRVPFVVAGPGVTPGAIDAPASLVDVTPTVLSLLRVPLTPEAEEATPGRAVFSLTGEEPRYFSCWHSARCSGFVLGETKLVYSADTRRAVTYDLAADPTEELARPATSEWLSRLPELRRVVEAHRDTGTSLDLAHELSISAWHCPPDARCEHRDAVAVDRK